MSPGFPHPNLYANIQDVKGYSRTFTGKFDSMTTTVKMANELLKIIFSMCPAKKYIVNISHPDQGLLSQESKSHSSKLYIKRLA